MEPAGPEGKKSSRRACQDYTKLDDYLPVSVWRSLGSATSGRHRVEILSEFLYVELGLRLPNESTYAVITAVAESLSGVAAQSDMYDKLQITKSTWRSTVDKLKKQFPDSKSQSLITTLPDSVMDLPSPERENLTRAPPAKPEERPISSTAVHKLAVTAPLRNSHASVVARRKEEAKAQSGDAAMQMLRALSYFIPHKFAEPEGRSLKNLKIFSPEKGQPQSITNNAAASRADHREVTLRETLQRPQTHHSPHKLLALADATPPAEMGVAETVTLSSHVEDKEQPSHVEARPAGRLASHAEDSLPGKKPSYVDGFGAADPAKGHTSPSNLSDDGLAADARAFKTQREAQQSSRPGNKATLKRPASAAGAIGSQKKPCLKRPAAAGLDRLSAPRVTESPGKKLAETLPNFTFCAKVWGECKAEFYAQKSYIRRWDTSASKYVMVIGSSAPDHKKICQLLTKHVKAGLSREDLLKARDRIWRRVSSDPEHFTLNEDLNLQVQNNADSRGWGSCFATSYFNA